jgi:hypothetical protein
MAGPLGRYQQNNIRIFNQHANDPLGRGGYEGFRDLLSKYFLPELDRVRGAGGPGGSPIEKAFYDQTLNPGSLYGAASTAATGKANELFAPGGEVSSLIQRARGQSSSQGFNPESSIGGENVILRGATKQVADTFASNAGALEGARYNSLTGAYSAQQQAIRDLMESLFAGVGTAEQYKLAKNPPRQKFLGIL